MACIIKEISKLELVKNKKYDNSEVILKSWDLLIDDIPVSIYKNFKVDFDFKGFIPFLKKDKEVFTLFKFFYSSQFFTLKQANNIILQKLKDNGYSLIKRLIILFFLKLNGKKEFFSKTEKEIQKIQKYTAKYTNKLINKL